MVNPPITMEDLRNPFNCREEIAALIDRIEELEARLEQLEEEHYER